MNRRDSTVFGSTPLMKACFAGASSSVRFLLSQRADMEVRNRSYRQTALTVACSRGTWDAAAYLINAKANTEVRDNDGWSPLRVVQSKYGVEDDLTLEEFIEAKMCELHGDAWRQLLARGPSVVESEGLGGGRHLGGADWHLGTAVRR